MTMRLRAVEILQSNPWVEIPLGEKIE